MYSCPDSFEHNPSPYLAHLRTNDRSPVDHIVVPDKPVPVLLALDPGARLLLLLGPNQTLMVLGHHQLSPV